MMAPTPFAGAGWRNGQQMRGAVDNEEAPLPCPFIGAAANDQPLFRRRAILQHFRLAKRTAQSREWTVPLVGAPAVARCDLSTVIPAPIRPPSAGNEP